MATQGAAIDRSLIRRSLGFLRPYGRLEALLIVVLLVANALQIAVAYLFRPLVDEVLVGGNFGLFVPIVVGIALVRAMSFALYALRGYLAAWVHHGALSDLRAAICRSVLSRPLAFFHNREPGELASRVIVDALAVRDVTANVLVEALTDGLQIAAVGVVLFALEWRIAVLVACVVPVAIAGRKLFSRRIRDCSRAESETSGRLNALVTECFSGASTVRAFGLDDYVLHRIRETSLALKRAAVRGSLYEQAVSVISNAAPFFLDIAVYAVGSVLVARQQLSVGTLMAVANIAFLLYWPATSLTRLGASLQKGLAGTARALEFLGAEAPETGNTAHSLSSRIDGRIDFEDVSFGYDAARFALDSISFHVPPGSTYAIVGATGSGKSTIMQLIMRFHEPLRGCIRVGGVDTSRVEADDLRSIMGYVPQETFLFTATLLENIRMGRLDATADEVARLAEDMQLSELLASLPAGLDTGLGERGARLSGGERQRIAIARAVIRRPRILLLDEATSGIDSETEERLLTNVQRLLPTSTILIASHRLSTVSRAKCALLLSGGKVVAEGFHDFLMNTVDSYAALWRDQLAQGNGPPAADVE